MNSKDQFKDKYKEGVKKHFITNQAIEPGDEVKFKGMDNMKCISTQEITMNAVTSYFMQIRIDGGRPAVKGEAGVGHTPCLSHRARLAERHTGGRLSC